MPVPLRDSRVPIRERGVLMKLPCRVWYIVVAMLAVAPVGMRVVTWHKQRPQPLDQLQVEAGEVLFNHKWVPNDPLANGGDGLGPVYNADSCVACHKQGGVGGSGDVRKNVTVFTVVNSTTGKVREGVVHARAVKFQENLSQV